MSEAKRLIPPVFGDVRITDHKNRLNESMLYIFFKDRPAEALNMLTLTSSELLELAINSDEINQATPWHDLSKQHFARESYDLLKLAEMVEKREKYIHEIRE